MKQQTAYGCFIGVRHIILESLLNQNSGICLPIDEYRIVESKLWNSLKAVNESPPVQDVR